MLSSFSCASWPSVCLLWRNVYLGLLPISGLGFLKILISYYFLDYLLCSRNRDKHLTPVISFNLPYNHVMNIIILNLNIRKLGFWEIKWPLSHLASIALGPECEPWAVSCSLYYTASVNRSALTEVSTLLEKCNNFIVIGCITAEML